MVCPLLTEDHYTICHVKFPLQTQRAKSRAFFQRELALFRIVNERHPNSVDSLLALQYL